MAEAAEIRSDEIIEERRGRGGSILWLTFNRPEARNALIWTNQGGSAPHHLQDEP